MLIITIKSISQSDWNENDEIMRINENSNCQRETRQKKKKTSR